MLVTINTDASYSYTHKIGAYSFWISTDKGKIVQSGVLKNKIRDSNEAELMCIINALHTVSKQDWEHIKCIIINTDSLNSMHLIRNAKFEIKKYKLKHLKPLVAKFNSIKQQIEKKNGSRIKLYLKHVRSHRSTDTAREWVNDYCDKKAKEALCTLINFN